MDGGFGAATTSLTGDDPGLELECDKAGEEIDSGVNPWLEADARRDSRILPSFVRRSSCNPTDHPARYVGIAYAIDAKILFGENLIASDNGGHAVCDFREDIRRGGPTVGLSQLSVASSEKIYSERSCASVMVRRYGEA